MIIPTIKSYRLGRIFNMKKELRRIRRRKQKTEATAERAETLIGHAGRRAVYIPDTAKHVFVCGTTGSGKTVALSNFIKHIVDNDYPAVIVDGKGGATGCVLKRYA